MPDFLLGYGQMLAVAVIVGGVAVALGQVCVLTNRLRRRSDRDPIAAHSDQEAIERAARERILAGTGGRTQRRSDQRGAG